MQIINSQLMDFIERFTTIELQLLYTRMMLMNIIVRKDLKISKKFVEELILIENRIKEIKQDIKDAIE